MEQTIDELKEIQYTITSQLLTTQEEVTRRKERESELESTNTALLIKLEEASGVIEELKKTVEDEKLARQQLEEQQLKLNSEIDMEMAQLQESISEETTVLRSQVDKLREDNSKLHEEISFAIAEKERTEKALNDTITLLRGELADAHRESRVDLRRKDATMRAELERTVTEKEDRIRSLQSKLERAREKVADRESSLRDAEDQLAERQQSLLTVRETLASLEGDVQAQTSNLTRLQSRHEEIMDNVREFTSSLSSSASSLHRLTERVILDSGSQLESGLKRMKSEHEAQERLVLEASTRARNIHISLEREKSTLSRESHRVREEWIKDRDAFLHTLRSMDDNTQQRVREVAGELSATKDEQAILHANLEVRAREIVEMKERLRFLESNNVKQLAEAAEMNRDLQERLVREHDRVQMVEKSYSEVVKGVKSGSRQMDDVKRLQVTLRQSLERQTTQLAELDSVYQASLAEVEHERQENEKMSQQIIEYQEEMRREMESALSRHFTVSKKLLDDEKQKNKELEHHNTSLMTQLQSVESSLQQQVSEVSAERDRLLKEITELKARPEVTKEEQERMLVQDEKMTFQRERIAQLEEQIERLHHDLDSLIEEREGEDKASSVEIQSLKTQTTELVSQLEKVQKDVEITVGELEKEKKKLSSTSATLITQMQELQNGALKVEKDKIAAESRIVVLEEENADLSRQNNNNETILATQKRQLEKLESQLSKLSSELRVSRAEAVRNKHKTEAEKIAETTAGLGHESLSRLREREKEAEEEEIAGERMRKDSSGSAISSHLSRRDDRGSVSSARGSTISTAASDSRPVSHLGTIPAVGGMFTEDRDRLSARSAKDEEISPVVSVPTGHRPVTAGLKSPVSPSSFAGDEFDASVDSPGLTDEYDTSMPPPPSLPTFVIEKEGKEDVKQEEATVGDGEHGLATKHSSSAISSVSAGSPTSSKISATSSMAGGKGKESRPGSGASSLVGAKSVGFVPEKDKESRADELRKKMMERRERMKKSSAKSAIGVGGSSSKGGKTSSRLMDRLQSRLGKNRARPGLTSTTINRNKKLVGEE
ncbi:hypothetical protein ADUPG1_008971 [Aduncisulcus paluster]|uniref:Uncharacterized protein n=1 Tax=Aduncisulcus paluster TaxID=2918883 RepID=A0ABQ5KW69_9EUKA|nr:hypothetical protein ADUPG1_008971 [Aduncisulcus paluster]